MQPRTVIATPYPSIRATAEEVGVGQARVHQLRRLMEAIARGQTVVSLALLGTRRSARHKAARVRKAGTRRPPGA